MDMVMTTLGGLGLLGFLRARKAKEAPAFGEDGAPRLPQGPRTDIGKSLHGVMTPGRQDLFERAMRQKAPKATFYTAAEGFDRAGLPFEAKMLRARGDSRDADEATHEKRRVVVRKAFQSRDPEAVERFADVAEMRLGMTVTAGKLREYAQGLRQAQSLRAPQPGTERGIQAPSAGAQVGLEGPPYDGSPDMSATHFADEPYPESPGRPVEAGPDENGDEVYAPQYVRPLDPGLPKCGLNAGGECVVHGVGGCILEEKSYVPPPPVGDAPDEIHTFDRGGTPGTF